MVEDLQNSSNALTIRVAQATPLVEMAAGAGLPVEQILRSAGLAASLSAGSEDARMKLADFFRLQKAIAAALQDETCQLSKRQLLPGTTDFVLSQLSGETSLTVAMKVLATYYNLLHGGEFNSVGKRGRAIVFTTDDRRFPYRLKDLSYLRFSMECVQIFLHCMLATLSESVADNGLRRVSVIRGPSDPDAGHLAFWRAPIRFNAPTYSLDYDAAAASTVFPLPPHELLTSARVYEEIIALIESREGATAPRPSVSAMVRDGLRMGAVDQKKIAALVGASPATLRRRLAAEGASFRELRREVLNEAAKSMLAKRRPVADVADALGFSDFRSFNRAFRDWNGVSPKRYAAALSVSGPISNG